MLYARHIIRRQKRFLRWFGQRDTLLKTTNGKITALDFDVLAWNILCDYDPALKYLLETVKIHAMERVVDAGFKQITQNTEVTITSNCYFIRDKKTDEKNTDKKSDNVTPFRKK